jgi:DNA-binding beta-propeller fold protein YncE
MKRLAPLIAILAAVVLGVVVLAAGGETPQAIQQTSATAARVSRPARLKPPKISGTARVGVRLRASHGSWSHKPRSYKYAWERCNARGARCTAIRGARASSYLLGSRDLGRTLRVSVIAANAAGRARPALSAHTAVVLAAAPVAVAPVPQTGVQHLEYVFTDGHNGVISVYNMDQGQALVKTISLPQINVGIRGVTVSPAKHLLFISYGGDGGGNGTGSVLAYDLVAEKVLWSVHLNTGIDSGAVSPDGTRLYMPTGENTSSGVWNILDTSNGAVIGTIQGGEGPHNTIVSADGRYVYMGGRNHNYLEVYDTTKGQVRSIGPLESGVRPFTVNSSNTLAFTTATGFDGFQVSSVTSGKVLFTVPFAAFPSGFPFTTASHGISLSPDEKQLYVIDAVNRQVRVYDVSRVSQGVAPALLGVIGVSGLNGSENTCAYDCGRDGWLQHSVDGRFVYVGDSGEVIETATRKVITVLPTLANTRKSLEIDWANGVPVATSGRTGVGHPG